MKVSIDPYTLTQENRFDIHWVGNNSNENELDNDDQEQIWWQQQKQKSVEFVWR